jgi:hypothetical protein
MCLIPLLFHCLCTYLHVYVLTIWPGFNPRYGQKYFPSPAIQTYSLAYPGFCPVDKKEPSTGMNLSDSAAEFVYPQSVEIKNIRKWREI